MRGRPIKRTLRDHGGRGRLHLGSTKYLSGILRSMFSFVENSVPAPFLLVRGVLGVLAGVALIYVGVYVV